MSDKTIKVVFSLEDSMYKTEPVACKNENLIGCPALNTVSKTWKRSYSVGKTKPENSEKQVLISRFALSSSNIFAADMIQYICQRCKYKSK